METKPFSANKLKPKLLNENIDLEIGKTILGRLKVDARGDFFLDDYPSYSLKVAASCLVSPCAEDYISAIFTGDDFFITAILQRKSKKEKIVLDLSSSEAKIIAKDLEINATKNVTLSTKNYLLKTENSEIYSSLAKCVYNEIYTVAQNSYKDIKQNDEYYSKNHIIKVTQTYTLRNKVGVIQSDAILKIDGTQVHMG